MFKCRACLKSTRNMVPFDETFITYFNILTNLNLKLTEDPQLLCKHCLKTLQQFIDFREKCLAANAVFSECNKQCIKQEAIVLTEVKQELKADEDDFNNTSYEIDFTDYFNEVDGKFKYDENAVEESVLKIEGKKGKSKDIKPSKRSKKCMITAKENFHFEEMSSEIEKSNIIIYEKTSGNSLPCGLCTESFEDIVQLKSHLATHMLYNSCSNCEERLVDWQELIAHRMIHLPRMRVPCHLCQQKFRTSLQMEHHFRNNHNSEGERQTLRCRTCDRKFGTPRRLRYHCIETHNSRNKTFYCDYCNKLCLTKAKLKSHILTHMDTKPYHCDLCDFTSKMKHQLMSHKIFKHNPEKAYCLRCKRVFVSLTERDKHVCKESDSICPVCGKIFRSKAMVNRHAHIHDKNHWYKCDRCPAKFKGKTSLVVHQNKHDGIRKHACEFCPAKFYFASVLIKHRRTHTGIKPYVCKICQKGFTGNHNLKMHMRVHGKFLINKKEPRVDQTLLQQQAVSLNYNKFID